MTPAERVALLTALKDACEAELALAKTDALTVADAVGVKQFTTPGMGNVTVGQEEAKPYWSDPDAFKEYVAAHFPTEIEDVPATTRVRGAFASGVLGSVTWDKESCAWQYVDGHGEVHDIPGIRLGEPGKPYITWPTGVDQKRTKAEAKAWFHQRHEAILSTLPHGIESKAS